MTTPFAASRAVGATAPAPSRFRYVIMVLLLLVTVANFVDRGALAYASAPIIKAYGFSKAEWGAVLGYFGYGYVIGTVLGGASADRWGSRRVWAIAGGSWAFLEMATAFAGDVGLSVLAGSALAGFAVMRILFGLAEGPAFVLLNKSVSQWAGPGERGLMSSLVILSGPLGAMISAPIAVGLLHGTGDWRLAFIIIGAVSLALVALFAAVFTDRPEQNRRVDAAELATIRAGRTQDGTAIPPGGSAWRAYFSSATLILNTVGLFSSLYITFLVLTWIPKFLQDTFAFDPSSLWYVGMIPWVGSCLMVVLGGWLSDRLYALTADVRLSRSLLAAASLVGATAFLICTSVARSAGAVICCITIANALNSMTNSAYYTMILHTSEPAVVGKHTGLTLMLATLSSIVAPTMTGVIVSRFGYGEMFLFAALISGLGALAMFLIRPSRH